MSQERFQYDYSDPTDARKNAKRYKLAEQWAWVVQNPKTRRYVVLFGDTESDGPTRVKPLYTFEPDPPKPVRLIDDGERFRALMAMIQNDRIIINVPGGFKIEGDALEDLCNDWIETYGAH